MKQSLIVTYINGDRYEGILRDNKKHGHGTYRYINGDKYTGEWLNHKTNGQGTFIWLDGRIDIKELTKMVRCMVMVLSILEMEKNMWVIGAII